MAESELGVKLVPDESAIEEVEDRELEFGGGGDLSPSQRNDRQSVVSGGFRTALKATGLVALLSGLKPITATLGAILGAVSRSLIPGIEAIAEEIRPIFEGASEAAEKPGEVVSGFSDFFGIGLDAQRQGNVGIATGLGGTMSRAQIEEDLRQSRQNDNVIESLAESIGQIISGQGNGSPDLSGEATKIDTKNRIESDADKLGEIQ